MFSSLPTELLIEIFESLDYITLKNVSAVNRRFRAIVEDNHNRGTLADTLFRTGLPGEHLTPPSKIELHPCFRYLTIEPAPAGAPAKSGLRPGLKRIGFISRSGKFIPISESPIASENATRPASSFVDFNICWREKKAFNTIIRKTPGQAVTVLSVVRQLDATLDFPILSEAVSKSGVVPGARPFKDFRILNYTMPSGDFQGCTYSTIYFDIDFKDGGWDLWDTVATVPATTKAKVKEVKGGKKLPSIAGQSDKDMEKMFSVFEDDLSPTRTGGFGKIAGLFKSRNKSK